MKTAYYNAQIYTGSLPLSQAFIVENGFFTKNHPIVFIAHGDGSVTER